MKHFISVADVENPISLAQEALHLKNNPINIRHLGIGKTLGLIFFNNSLRTRMSTIRAAYHLGMDVMVLNVAKDAWQLEVVDGVIMNSDKAEHIKEAIPIMTTYCDVLGVRSFPELISKEEDYKDKVIHQFVKLGKCPIINLESAMLHPLQSLADLMTIIEIFPKKKPKVVMTWAPHVKPLPQSVPNSFAEWMLKADMPFTSVQPVGMELSSKFTDKATIVYDQKEALKNAEIVYVKNWSSVNNYGKLHTDPDWIVTKEKLQNAKLMHCLPLRRNIVISDDAADSDLSVIQQQAYNRLFASQIILKKLIEK